MTETEAGEDGAAEEAGTAPLFVDSAADDAGAEAEDAGVTDDTGAGTDEATSVEEAGTAALVVDSEGVTTDVYDGVTEVTV